MKAEPQKDGADRQLVLLRQFLRVLTEERDAIVSFSLEGIIRANNMKEEILKKLELIEDDPSYEARPSTDPERLALVKQVRAGLEKNMRLLSFSMDHVKTSIERMIGFINRASYGKRKDPVSFIVSRKV